MKEKTIELLEGKVEEYLHDPRIDKSRTQKALMENVDKLNLFKNFAPQKIYH